MEYCDEGTLEEVSRLGLQEHVIRLYSKQTTTAINVLHEHGIVHRDIKGLRLMPPPTPPPVVLILSCAKVVYSSKKKIRRQHLPDLIWVD